jgi:hypothetical protein
MSKRPPLGKLALAGKRNHERQLLDREQRERDRRDLLSLVGENSSLAVSSSTSGQGTPSRNERYLARVASAEKARPSSPPAAVVVACVDTNIRAHGITDVVEKIVFDGDGGQPAPKTSFELDAVDEESDSGTEDDADADDSMGSSGSSGGGARMRAERAARDAAPLVTLPPVPDVIVEAVPAVPNFFSCCVDTYCRSVDDQTSPRQVCINCNSIAHLACCDNLLFQNPVVMEFVVTPKDFSRAAKSRIRATPKSQHETLFFCFLCMANIRAAKEKKMAKKAAPRAPRKTSLNVKFPAKILAELRRVAAFHCQSFVFLECEKTNRKGTYALMEERFYGDPEKRIKGVCDQLIDGDNAFAFLYNKHEGVNGVERTLKEMCCGNSTSTNYVAGVHFTAKMIGTKSHKKLSGGSLWRAGLDVARSIKKAMAILPKLDVKVVNLGNNLQVLGYASGKNFENFIQYIDNGMYSLSLKEGKGAANLEESDDDNEVLGKVACDGVIGKLDNDDVQEVTEQHLDSWNPFDSDDAPEGYLFFGKLSFLCLGPASDFFSETLSSKGKQVTSVEEKKSMGRAAMLKEVTARATVNRDVGGSDRGMSLATKASFGFMAQNEDDAVQRHLDMRWATITKLIDTTQKMIDVKMRLADSMVGNRMCDELRMSVLKMMEKIEKWNEEMEQMMEEKRESNPIVGRVLEHAARSMGLAVPSTNRRTDVTLATVGSGLGVATITTTTGGTSKNDDETDLFV